MTEFQNFVRKQFPVSAARVTPLNIEELAEACGGRIMHDGEKEGNFSRDYIKVRVAYPLNEEQTKARIGDWLVKQGRTFKVYKDKPFRTTFENPDGTPVPGGNNKRGGQNPHKGVDRGPSPANMPKKKAENSVADEQAAFAAEQVQKAQKMERDEVLEGPKLGESDEKGRMYTEEEVKADPAVADVKQEDIPVPPTELPPPTPPAPNPEAAEVGEMMGKVMDNMENQLDGMEERLDELEKSEAEKPKTMTLDELNDQEGDPRTAEDIYREARETPQS